MNPTLELVAIWMMVLLGVWRLLAWGRRWRELYPKQQETKSGEDEKKIEKGSQIEPLLDFNWRKTEPLKFRPFKSKYHLTMGLQNCTPSELLEMDNTYLTRITLRREIMAAHPDITLAASPTCIPAIDELYTYLISTYLPQRFPTMFALDQTHLHNLVTTTSLPLKPSADPIETLRILGENIDEDFLWLQPSTDGDGYVLAGFVVCFPAGFNTRQKFGLKLREVHAPVPGYAEKIGKSMDRFFERLEVGKLVRRVNWSITTHDRLYAASGGNHLYEGEDIESEDVDISKTYLRCERQMLHRLPQSQAILFSYKTYMYPIAELKAEGHGEDLAEAVDGLKEGSVPAMHFYKRGVIWGDAVKAFLRS